MPPDATELSRRLATSIISLARELLPRGVRDGHEWHCGNLSGDAGRSLGVHLTGHRAGVWCDFASGEAGDALDLVASVRFGGDRRQAMAWARTWLGREFGAVAEGPADPLRRPPAPTEDADAASRRRGALRLFLEAHPNLSGTPAALYLSARRIDLADLGRQPRSLRYHPNLANRESGRSWPALVAAITNRAGEHVATHRTWLARDVAGVWRKAPLRDRKLTLGSYAGGSIRLWRGASGKPLAQAPEGEVVAIAEGVETALSSAIACPELRVLAAVALANMARIELPPAIRIVILCADNDGDNPAAARGVARAVRQFAAAGREVRIARSPVGKDFNDALRAEVLA